MSAHETIAAARNPEGVAVIIGNKGYSGRIPEVAYADRDAEAMKRFVIDVQGYDPDNVIDLRDATLAQMMDVFGSAESHQGRLWSYLTPGKSDVVVYYSGHGVPDTRARRGYLLPVNANPDTPQVTGYPIERLSPEKQASR